MNNEVLLQIAKENFPIGTKFVSLFGGTDEVFQDKFRKELFRIDRFGEVYVGAKKQERLIYDGKWWAEIISTPKTEPTTTNQ